MWITRLFSLYYPTCIPITQPFWIPLILTAIAGGGIYHSGGLTLTRSKFTDNRAGQNGLAIGSDTCGSSWVEVQDVYFYNNHRYCPAGLYQPYNLVVRKYSWAAMEFTRTVAKAMLYVGMWKLPCIRPMFSDIYQVFRGVERAAVSE